MKKLTTIAVLIAAFVFYNSHAVAYELSADVVNKSAGNVTTSKLFMKANKVRMDSRDGSYAIIRPDLQKTWFIMPKQQSYMEIKDSGKNSIPAKKPNDEATRKQTGTAVIDGHPTKKYEITYKHAGKTNKMQQWMATDINFPVKQTAADGSWSTEYKNIKMGPQMDRLFELPAGYKLMSMPTIPPVQKPGERPKKVKKGAAKDN